MDEEYWRAFRKRARRRAGAQMLLIIAPVGILVAILKILGPMDYPAGDLRNSMEFRLIPYGLFIAFDLALIFGAARLLARDASSGDG